MNPSYYLHKLGIIRQPLPDFRKPDGASRVHLPSGYRIEDKGDAKETQCWLSESGGRIVIDGRWRIILSGKRQHGDGGQSEKQDPLARCTVPVWWKNCWIEDNKNALFIDAPNSIVEDCVWLNVGEDALATGINGTDFLAKNLVALNTRKTADKTWQFNQARGLRAIRLVQWGGITGMRIGESSWNHVQKDKAMVDDCLFIGCETGINASSCYVSMVNCRFNAVNKPTVTNNGAIIKS